jgi:DNA-binding MarR family transcriptional regulator
MSSGASLTGGATGVSTSATPARGVPAEELEELADLLRETVIRLQPSSDEISEAWSTAQITMQQLRVMTILYHEGPTRVSDLARRLDVSTPTITGILDRLVRQRLSYRLSDPRDRRVVLNSLTQDGRDLVEKLLPAHGSQVELALARLSDDERLNLAASLRALLRVIPPLS